MSARLLIPWILSIEGYKVVRSFNYLYRAMPSVVLTYALAVLFMFCIGLLDSDHPLLTFEAVKWSFSEQVSPYIDGFKLTLALWVGTGITEKFYARNRKVEPENDQAKPFQREFAIVGKDGKLIPKIGRRKRIRRHKLT